VTFLPYIYLRSSLHSRIISPLTACLNTFTNGEGILEAWFALGLEADAENARIIGEEPLAVHCLTARQGFHDGMCAKVVYRSGAVVTSRSLQRGVFPYAKDVPMSMC
jgi:hypothetical protein